MAVWLCVDSVALIVGLTVTAILVVSGIIAIACCCMRRRAAAGQVITTNPQMGPGAIVVNSESLLQVVPLFICTLCSSARLGLIVQEKGEGQRTAAEICCPACW